LLSVKRAAAFIFMPLVAAAPFDTVPVENAEEKALENAPPLAGVVPVENAEEKALENAAPDEPLSEEAEPTPPRDADPAADTA
jgi:hypothetical protein